MMDPLPQGIPRQSPLLPLLLPLLLLLSLQLVRALLCPCRQEGGWGAL